MSVSCSHACARESSSKPRRTSRLDIVAHRDAT
jgi:hypothetical protein